MLEKKTDGLSRRVEIHDTLIPILQSGAKDADGKLQDLVLSNTRLTAALDARIAQTKAVQATENTERAKYHEKNARRFRFWGFIITVVLAALTVATFYNSQIKMPPTKIEARK
jgi:hypothetical protein